MQPEVIDHPYHRFLAGISNRRYYKALFEEVLVRLTQLCLSDRLCMDDGFVQGTAETTGCTLDEACVKTPKKQKSTKLKKKKQKGSEKFGHIIEICDVPLERGLGLLWRHFTEAGFYSERVTPSCLLAKFSSCAEARCALKLLAKEFVKARSISEASDEAKAKILQAPLDWALVFKPRPRSDGSTAARLNLSKTSLTDKHGPLSDPSCLMKDRLFPSPFPRCPVVAKSKTADTSGGSTCPFGQPAHATQTDSGQQPRLDVDLACRFVCFHLGLNGKTSSQREAC